MIHLMDSGFCTYAQLNSAPFLHWQDVMRRQPPRPHRKDWELSFIAEALSERGLLREGKRGMGFGCGVEPLPCLFASLGVKVTASDGPMRVQWSGQHLGGALYRERIEGQHLMTDGAAWDRLCYVTDLDMTSIKLAQADAGLWDFVWSTSALEHLGSMGAARTFLLDSLDYLKPGGVAVHVSEHSICPEPQEQEQEQVGGTVWWRRADLKRLLSHLERAGYRVRLDWGYGIDPLDYYLDAPPWAGAAHLKLLVDGCVTTSVGLIIERPVLS